MYGEFHICVFIILGVVNPPNWPLFRTRTIVLLFSWSWWWRCLFTRNFYSVLAREYSYKNTRKQHTHLSTIRFTECNILWIHWFIFTQKEPNYIQTKRQTNKAVRMKPNTRNTDLFCGYIDLLSHNKNSISFKPNHKRTETYTGRQIPQH